MLVDLERAVHLPVHLGADRGQPDAIGRPAQARQDAAEGAAHRFGDCTADNPGRGPAAAPSSDWTERDRALILTALLAGLRADELLRANVGDLRRTDEGAVIHVHGKGGKDRRIPIEAPLVEILEHYLDSRASRFPTTAKKRSSPAGGLAAWSPSAPLFVGADGDRISRGTLQYRVLRAFRRAGIDGDRARGALVHGLRHTFATELANSDVSVYTLMTLLGHESMVTSQRYVTAAGTETRGAAAQNKLYGLLSDDG